MTFSLHRSFNRRLALFVAGPILCSLLFLPNTAPVQAQSAVDESYNCGTYGAGAFGENACLAAGEMTPTPSASGPAGSSPDTGAHLGLWAAIGALILAVGLGLYGWSHHKRRSHPVSSASQ